MVTSFMGVRKPTNAIVERGDPNIQELKIGTVVTNAKPGAWCIKGTNDDDIIITDSPTGASAPAEVVGFLGYEHTSGQHQPANSTTAYAASAKIAVLNGPGTYLRAILSAVNGTKGELLTTGESGMLTGLATPAGGLNAAQTYPIVRLMESVDASTVITPAVVELLLI